MNFLSEFLSIERGHWNLIIVGITVFAMIVYTLIGYNFKNLEDAPVSMAILSFQAQSSNSIFMVSTIPSVLSTALDYPDFFNPIKWKRYTFGRLPVAIVGLLVGIQFFAIAETPNIFSLTSSRAESYLLSLSCLKVVLTGSLVYIPATIKPSIFSGKVTSLFTLIVCAFVSIGTYTPGSSPAFHQFSGILNYIFLALIICILIHWVIQLTKLARNMDVGDFICISCIFICLVGLFGSYVNVFLAWSTGARVIDFSTITSQEFAITNYCYTFVFIMLAIAPGRIARFEATTYLVRHMYCTCCHDMVL